MWRAHSAAALVFGLFSALLLVTATHPAHCQDCEDYRDHLRWIGQADTGGFAWHVKVEGSYAYVGDWTEGLVIADIKELEGRLANRFFKNLYSLIHRTHAVSGVNRKGVKHGF